MSVSSDRSNARVTPPLFPPPESPFPAVTPVISPVVGVAHEGTPDAKVNTSASEPLANFVTVPEEPPYNISPSAVIGDRASKPAVAVPAPVPPSAIATSVPPALYTALPSIVISPELALAIVVSEACPSSIVPAVVIDKSSLIVKAVASAFKELPEPLAFAVWNIIAPPAPEPFPCPPWNVKAPPAILLVVPAVVVPADTVKVVPAAL